MGAGLSSPNFWAEIATTYNVLKVDGSLQYVVLDNRFKMQPLVRNTKTTFTSFLASDADAKKCKVIVNGNYYGLDNWGNLAAFRKVPDDPSDTLIQGQVITSGRIIAGDSRPQSFWFGQVLDPRSKIGSKFTAAQGDPPAAASTLAAVGGAGPLIIAPLTYGVGNLYKPGAPAGAPEPPTGEPPPQTKPFLIQRNNATFMDVNKKPPTTGKTILAYCSAKQALLVAVQPHGAAPGETHADITNALAARGFDSAVFMDGSDSATLMFDGKLAVAPGERKDDTIDVGIGFRL